MVGNVHRSSLRDRSADRFDGASVDDFGLPARSALLWRHRVRREHHDISGSMQNSREAVIDEGFRLEYVNIRLMMLMTI